jgi:hypothetical protein
VTAEDHGGLDAQPRRPQAQERMHSEALAAGAEVVGSAERVGADEDAPLGPPEGNLLPAAPVTHGQELERPDSLPRDDVMRHAEAVRQLRTIAVVSVEQLDHARRSAGTRDQLVLEWIDQPGLPVDGERVRAALHELVGDPAEAAVELVYELHFAAHAS